MGMRCLSGGFRPEELKVECASQSDQLGDAGLGGRDDRQKLRKLRKKSNTNVQIRGASKKRKNGKKNNWKTQLQFPKFTLLGSMANSKWKNSETLDEKHDSDSVPTKTKVKDVE